MATQAAGVQGGKAGYGKAENVSAGDLSCSEDTCAMQWQERTLELGARPKQ